MGTSRDLLGRISDALLFASFLSFHVWYMSMAWHELILIAKINSLLISCTIILFLA